MQLTDLPGQERQAQIGPTAPRSCSWATPSGNPDIYLQRVGGRNPVNLTPDSPAADTAPAFSPDGERIAFRSERDGEGIYVMGSTGESVKRLTDFGHDPAWSPDGKQIVFSSGDGQNPWSRNALAQLWVVPSSGGEVRQLTKGGDAVQPSWSPSGRRIAFWGLRHDSGQRDLWTIPADAAGERGPGRGHERPGRGLGPRVVAGRPDAVLRERARRLHEPVARRRSTRRRGGRAASPCP